MLLVTASFLSAEATLSSVGVGSTSVDASPNSVEASPKSPQVIDVNAAPNQPKLERRQPRSDRSQPALGRRQAKLAEAARHWPKPAQNIGRSQRGPVETRPDLLEACSKAAWISRNGPQVVAPSRIPTPPQPPDLAETHAADPVALSEGLRRAMEVARVALVCRAGAHVANSRLRGRRGLPRRAVGADAAAALLLRLPLREARPEGIRWARRRDIGRVGDGIALDGAPLEESARTFHGLGLDFVVLARLRGLEMISCVAGRAWPDRYRKRLRCQNPGQSKEPSSSTSEPQASRPGHGRITSSTFERGLPGQTVQTCTMSD